MGTSRSILILSATAGLILWARPWDHRPGPGRGVVSGKTVDANGRGVAGASVVLRDAKGVVVGRAESGSDGDFQFDRCPVGRLQIAAGKLEVGAGERVVVVTADDRTDTTVPLTGALMTVGHR